MRPLLLGLLVACSTSDHDGDGYDVDVDDCNDDNPSWHPGAGDLVGDGMDQNCDNVDGADEDGDGYAGRLSGGADCNDAADLIHPGAKELANGLDDDCDGEVDDLGDDDTGTAFVRRLDRAWPV